MINIKHSEILKEIAQQEAVIISTGIMFLFIEGRTIIWKVASQKFDMDIFKEGMEISETAIAARAMKEKKILSEQIPRVKYGRRLVTVAIPLVDDMGEPVGAFSIVLPKLHPVAESFTYFAPIMTELFPEGAFMYMSDLTKIMYIQPSSKFTLPSIQIGYELKESDIAYQSIHTGKQQTRELGEERYGVPVYISNYPLFDEDENGNQSIVATLGIVVPKSTSGKLQNMSEKLTENIGTITQTVEQLAINASSINENEQNLYNSVETVNDILSEINKVTEFISTVARQSNMLGLNASIEASRVGEAGKGFAVVANEIRKLSVQSQETVPKIKKLTEEIQAKIGEVNDRCKKSIAASEEQASATEEISARIEELSTMTEELYLISKEL
jgi:hypothetical protein